MGCQMEIRLMQVSRVVYKLLSFPFPFFFLPASPQLYLIKLKQRFHIATGAPCANISVCSFQAVVQIAHPE